jgi:NAD(P)-dependent dehydrogenase (short-subunit alcohol dehydrogenase family)
VHASAIASPVSVSIVTPCYNGARFLEGTLRSAVEQSRPPLEVLVIDDGSTDDSAAIAERVGAPVRVIRQVNQGESVARNRGLAEASGTHVLFLDADDLIDVDSLAHLVDAVQGRHGAVAIMGCVWFESDPAAPYARQAPSRRAFFPDIIESNFGPPHCWLAPLEVVRAAGGFCEPLRWFEDWDLWWRVGLHATQLVPVPYEGARYRRHPQSQLATTSLADRTRGHAAVMTRMITALLDREELLAAHGDQLFWSAWTSLARARAEGVSWQELEPLSRQIRQLTRLGPPAVKRSWLARAVRLVGPRAGMALRNHAG